MLFIHEMLPYRNASKELWQKWMPVHPPLLRSSLQALQFTAKATLSPEPDSDT